MIVDQPALGVADSALDRMELLCQVNAGRPSSNIVRIAERWPFARFSRAIISGWVRCFMGLPILGDRIRQTVRAPPLRSALTIMLEGCGHWTGQERAAEVNAALIEFLKRLD
jgi:pimeloyl-ACP methyl ester carboxylesterase